MRRCGGRGTAKALAAASARFAFPCVVPFLGSNASDDEACDGVGPPPAEEAVREESEEDYSGEVGAEQGLFGVCDDGSAGEFSACTALRPRQQRHDEERQGREDNANIGVVWCVLGE